MKIESIEQANHEIKERYRDLCAYAKTYKVNLAALDGVHNNIYSDKLYAPAFAKLSYKLGRGSVSTDIPTTLFHKALHCLLMAKLATFEEPVFYPSMAQPLERFDEIMNMNQELSRIEMNY